MEMREVRREPLREFFFHSLAVSLAAENKTQKATERREKNVKGERASSPHSFLSLLSFSTHCSPLPPTSTSHTKTLSLSPAKKELERGREGRKRQRPLARRRRRVGEKNNLGTNLADKANASLGTLARRVRGRRRAPGGTRLGMVSLPRPREEC